MKLHLDFFLHAIILLFCFSESIKADVESNKHRRGGSGSMGLIAFPRVGRSGPITTNEYLDDEDENYVYSSFTDEYDELSKMDDKRTAMFNQPRIGRNDPYMLHKPRISRTPQSRFNTPRTGRSDPELQEYAHLLAMQKAIKKRIGPSASSGMWFGPRLGKRSIDDSESSTTRSFQKGQPEVY